MLRIDTHQHLIPPHYWKALQEEGIGEAGGRALPDWSPATALQTMAELNIATAILSVSTPGTTFLPKPADAASLARDLNDYSAGLVASSPERFGFFATVPMPHINEAVAETVRALDDLDADGVVLLANNAGTYLAKRGKTICSPRSTRAPRWCSSIRPTCPDRRCPVCCHGRRTFCSTRLEPHTSLVRNGIRSKYPNIRFILGHAGGFVPYASHRMALAIMADTGRSPADSLDDFSSFYFDTALSSSAAALPTLLAFAQPGRITFGPDWPFAPVAAGQYFAAGLDTYNGLDDSARAGHRKNQRTRAVSPARRARPAGSGERP